MAAEWDSGRETLTEREREREREREGGSGATRLVQEATFPE